MSESVHLACRRSTDETSNQGIDVIETSPDPSRKAIIDGFYQSDFVADCQGWNASRFDIGSDIEVTMPAHRWDFWLSEYQM